MLSQGITVKALNFRAKFLSKIENRTRLGNLFFDQYGLCPACEQGVIDRHVFYEGRYMGTELLPIQFIDYARPRPMTLEEANSLFQALFSASGW